MTQTLYAHMNKRNKKMNRIERQVIECEKIFANYSFGKGLIIRIYNELKNATRKSHSIF
jgi:hypothetical protein